MEYLFLSFAERLEKEEKEPNRKNEFYYQSLTDQFKALQKSIPLEKQTSNFNDFIEALFPTMLPKKYYISCPNFLREKGSSKDGNTQYLDNVVIRPELTDSMKQVLPDNQNLILIGTIVEKIKLKYFEVKGMQFIDDSMSSPYDKVIQAPACNSFGYGTGNSAFGGTFRYNIWTVPYVHVNEDTIFTPNFVYDLIQSCYTVSHPENLRKTYEEWQQYIEFRKYYLDEQSKRNFKLDRVEFIKTYAVNKKEYRKNSSIYSEYLLPGWRISSNDEIVVLSEQVEDAEEFPLIRLDAEEFPLIRLDIERNKKAFEDAKIIRRDKLVNEEERKIRSLASDNVFITTENPKQESKISKGKPIFFGELLENGYALGDRFKIISYDIMPDEHLLKLDTEYKNDIDVSYKKIDTKYEKIVEIELKQALKTFEDAQEKDINAKYETKRKKLDSTLENDVVSNNDKKINALIKQDKEKIEKRIRKEFKKRKDENKQEYNARVEEKIASAYNDIDIRLYYVIRNKENLSQYLKELENSAKNQQNHFKETKKSEIANKYKADIWNEKIAAKQELDKKLKEDKEKVIAEETIIRFSLYFRLGDTNNNIKDKQINTINSCQYIVYDSRAERAKISRQEAALNNFYKGYVKNLYLSTYLFNPQELNNITTEPDNWLWYLESLNEKQKEAVRKAVSSNGIFLLQGPPGTGKTQVIAETVAHLVVKGKKVLISSETHKAIDNVFERLPKIAEIVPIRLIPSNNTKKNDNEYDPKHLVDNFYLNISTNMGKAVKRYKNFKKNKEEFAETYEQLKFLKSKIEKSQSILDKANQEIKIYENKAKKINSSISLLDDKKDNLRIELDILRRTKRHIETSNLRPDEDTKTQIILDYRKELRPLFSKEIYVDIDLGQLARNIDNIKMDDVAREIVVINPESKRIILELQKEEIKDKMSKCKDEYDNVLPDKQAEFNSLQSQLRSLIKEIEQTEEPSNNDLELNTIFNSSFLVRNVDNIAEIISNIKTRISNLKFQFIQNIGNDISLVEEKYNELIKKISDYKSKIRLINEDIINIQENNDIKEIQEDKYKLETNLIKFFKDFEISEPFQNTDEALAIIKRKWEELETNFATKEQENKEKIPMYEKIAKYITSKNIIEDDRKNFTKDLFENANVFGITCTSNNRFSGRNVDALSDYNIDDIDIKSVGIDVVIIDEVSKSSFIDLLIPILYGKTVILVGDHRQLPPMYEFAKLRDDDFEGLDENIINKEINKKFTDLYEECFFKTLFEKLPDCYKTMLVQQYRCHEHIMQVFNHFYQGELKLGWSGQNNTKQHNIKLLSNDRNIIEPDKHIYFVDCKKNETHAADSTSMYNTGEALVVAELIRKLNNYFKQHSEREKLSIGVICTYGDQAGKIKDIIKSEKIKTNEFKTDVEKMIVSTVDDFQGDERDIIILSMVRNPENPARSNPGFILAYQRINVALSRARKLLIVVGNRKYLESKGMIDLPDVHGRVGMGKRNFRVYEEIISTIERYGKVIEDIDVLEDKEEK